ncbi:hypothetical protein HK102_013132, partial [Quaeritorhiza haematococci]
DVEAISTNIHDYDLKQLRQQLNQIALGVSILAFIHFKFGYIRPLVLQSVLSLKTLYGTQLVQVHLVGKSASGELARPWKPKTMFGQAQQPMTPKEVKAKERREAKKK